MAENEQERTEQPTPKRLEEARKKGQVPRSTELSAAAVILTVGGGLHFLGGYMGSRLNGLMSASLSLTRDQSVDESLMERGAAHARCCQLASKSTGEKRFSVLLAGLQPFLIVRSAESLRASPRCRWTPRARVLPTGSSRPARAPRTTPPRRENHSSQQMGSSRSPGWLQRRVSRATRPAGPGVDD
jgi:FlhB/HrpN/YscU/SpaS family protein